VIQRALIIQDGNVINAASLAVEGATAHPSVTMRIPSQVASVEPSDSVKALTPEQGTETASAEEENEFGVLGSDLKQREFEIILNTLRAQGGRRKETAEVLGVSARTLRYKMARMRDSGINIDSMLSV
jgi:two-component system response regulator FlrC